MMNRIDASENPRQGGSIALQEGQEIVDKPEIQSPIHIPDCILTSSDIELGYFESSIASSSGIAKEYIISGPQPGSLA